MKTKLSIVAAALLLLTVLPGVARAVAPGQLDEGFGRGGRVVTPAPIGAPWSEAQVRVAEAPDGGVLAGAGSTLARYTPDGELDPEFGTAGFVNIAVAGARFQLGDLDVDQDGRVVAIGTATSRAAGRAGSLAAVVRYLPDGELDPSFGGGDGIVTGSFGLRTRSPSGGPAVTARLGAVTAFGTILVVLGTKREEARCGGAPSLRRRDLAVAHLTAAGGLERSYGDHGLQRIDPLQSVTAIAFSPSYAPFLAGPVARKCGEGRRSAVVAIGPDGARRTGFAERGARRFTGAVAAITVDRRGRAVLLFKEKQKRRPRNEHVEKLVRLLPDGELDPSLNATEPGMAVYEGEGPLYKWSSVLVEPQGRILLVGTLIHVLPAEPPGSAGVRRFFMAMPVTNSGQIASGFGWLGYISITRFNPRADAAVSDALIDSEGDLLIAGTARWPSVAPRGGLALARLGLWH